jgi:alcohol dehydrogenase class IV
MSDVNVETVAEAMYDLVKEYHGKKNLKALDLQKAMIKKFGEDKVDKQMCKAAIRQIIDTGRCTYSYVGGSYIVLPPDKTE